MTRHPYQSQPDRAFWRRAVAAPATEDVDPVGPLPFALSREDAVMTAGSCFAQHIARYLRGAGFNALLTEPPHPIVNPDDAAEWNYGTYTARYGNIYVPRQLVQLFQRAHGTFSPVEDAWPGEGAALIDPFRPQIQPGGFSCREEYDADRAQHFAAVRRAFETLDVMVFTLGLTESWMSRADGAVFPLCPGVAGGTFDPDRHVFHNFTVDEIVEDLRSFLGLLREVNPAARLILTVSPVPLMATATGDHVLAATTYSKSVLRVACDMLARSEEGVAYFPSYEVITGPQARGRYFAEDLRSVREEGVAQVMRLFFRHVAGEEIAAGPAAHPATPDAAPDAHTAEMQRLVQVNCDEEALDIVPALPDAGTEAGDAGARAVAPRRLGRLLRRLSSRA